MPSTFETNLSKAVETCQALKTQFAKLVPEVKAKSGNYDNAVSMFWASKDHIKELEEEIKKGKNAKAPEDLKKWKDNHPKIFSRVKPATDEIQKLKKTATDLRTGVFALQKTVEQLNKDAARSAMADVMKANAALKALATDLKALAEGIAKQVTILDGLPKAPMAA